MVHLRAAALTDIGRVRRRNEDRYVLDEALGLFGVADGVGGLPGGAEAAELALAGIVAGLTEAGGKPVDLVWLVRKSNQAVHDLGLQMSPRTGIGSTLSIGQIRGNTLEIAHVGDSRCYVQRGEEFTALTEDHSVENEIRAQRARGEDVYFHEANRNALTRCIGQPNTLDVDLISWPLQARDRILFCTDGITGMISDSNLASIMSSDAEPEAILREIVALAIRRGGHDNATGVIVFIDRVE